MNDNATAIAPAELLGVALTPKIQIDAETGTEVFVFSAPLDDLAKAIETYRQDSEWADAENLHWQILDMLKEGESADDIIAEVSKLKPKGAKNLVGLVRKIIDDARYKTLGTEWQDAFGGIRVNVMRKIFVGPIVMRLFKFRYGDDDSIDFASKSGYLEQVAESMCHVRNWAYSRYGTHDLRDIGFKIAVADIDAAVRKFLVRQFDQDERYEINFSEIQGGNWQYGTPVGIIADSFLEHAHSSIARDAMMRIIETEYGKLAPKPRATGII